MRFAGLPLPVRGWGHAFPEPPRFRNLLGPHRAAGPRCGRKVQLPVVDARVRINMFDRCFRCGELGHARRNCPQAKKHPPAPDYVRPESWKPPPPPENPHIYPSDHWLLHTCSHCGKPAFVQCWNVGTGREVRPHPSRLEIALAG